MELYAPFIDAKDAMKLHPIFGNVTQKPPPIAVDAAGIAEFRSTDSVTGQCTH